MSAALKAACCRPFSNGTEESAWLSAWCEFCVRDHGMHVDNLDEGESCSLVLSYMVGVAKDRSGETWWPEAWLPEPDDGRSFLPSRMVCLAFEPCSTGPCCGDPGAADRAERVAEVTEYWRTRR